MDPRDDHFGNGHDPRAYDGAAKATPAIVQTATATEEMRALNMDALPDHWSHDGAARALWLIREIGEGMTLHASEAANTSSLEPITEQMQAHFRAMALEWADIIRRIAEVSLIPGINARAMGHDLLNRARLYDERARLLGDRGQYAECQDMIARKQATITAAGIWATSHDDAWLSTGHANG